MRLSIDTNIFVYALDVRDKKKQAIALDVIETALQRECLIALQCCGELYSATTRRLGRAPWEGAQAARNILASFKTFGTTRTAVERALAEAGAGRFSYWDALLLASALEAGCDYCLSEDMQDGARLGGLEVVNPFGPKGISERAGAIFGSAQE